MKHKNLKFSVIVLFVASAAFAIVKAPFKLPPAPAADSQALFNKYCTGSASSTQVPGVNYDDFDVQAAVKALSVVKEISYYFYGPVIKSYGLVNDDKTYKPAPAVPAVIKDDIRPATHALLVQTCGEFRDRPTMIQAKFEWYKRLFKLSVNPQQPIDPSKDLWPQVTAHSYHPFLNFGRAVYAAKVNDLLVQGKAQFKLGKYEGVDAPVPAATMCETKYMFAKYVAGAEYLQDPKKLQALEAFLPNNANGSYDEYKKGFQIFKAQYCVKPIDTAGLTEEDYVYDYRGDKNFKHNSPEANGMIWTATSIAAHCKGSNLAPDEVISAKDQDACERYFKYPFAMRWNTARAALGAWMLHSSETNVPFENPNTSVTLIQHLEGYNRPLDYSLDGTTKLSSNDPKNLLPGFSISNHWHLVDFGFNGIVGLGTSNYNQDMHYERLRDAVNRHSNWYNSAFDDEMGWKMTQVYSPLVASSHEMSASNGFASGSDGRLAWMFVFKVKKSNAYNTQSVKDGQKVNFDTQWFDETSLGTAIGAFTKSERAFDRLGTALEGEFDAILYLHNLSWGGVSDDSQEINGEDAEVL